MWQLNRFADNQTGFYLNKVESFVLSLTITFAGFFFCYWELYFYDISHSYFELYYLLALLTPYILLKTGYYLFQYLSKKGRYGLMIANLFKEKTYVKQKLLRPDPKRKSYKKISAAYEKYLLDIYQKNYLQNNCWHEHYAKIHDQINLLIGGSDDYLKDKVIAIVGCGPEPGERDFSPRLLNLLRKGQLKKVVLIDFSKTILVSAINNLIRKGVDPSRIKAYQVDLTKGLSSYFTCTMLDSGHNDYAITLEKMHRDLETKSVEPINPTLIEEDDRFDFFISSMFATATLVPVINKCMKKLVNDEDLDEENRLKLIDSCRDFHRRYNSKIVELSTRKIISLGKENQRGLIIADTEKIYKGNKEVQNVVYVPMAESLRKNEMIKDLQLFHWIWQDESDHYHTIQSLILDIKQ